MTVAIGGVAWGWRGNFMEDLVRISLILLSFWLIRLSPLTQYYSRLKMSLSQGWAVMMLFLIGVFCAPDILRIYYFFEMTLIPIFIIIMGWGYQIERLLASLMLFFYTFLASLPLLLLILLRSFLGGRRICLIIISGLKLGTLSFVMGITAFLVKFPAFLVHSWLPKAHVEAPVSGSMLLAGILLKLGGYGLIRLTWILNIRERFFVLGSLILLGGGGLGILCLGVRDIKILIAYSSVVHIALIIFNLKVFRGMGLAGGIIIIIAHGICSSGLFALANMFYERSHSRSFVLNKGVGSKSPFVLGLMFFLIRANFGGPFSFNLLGEVILIASIARVNLSLIIRLLLLSFFSAAYSLVLYRSLCQGFDTLLIRGSQEFSSRELRVLIAHVWPLCLLRGAPIFF